MEKSKQSQTQSLLGLKDFRSQSPGLAFKAQGFYDYGRRALTLQIDRVDCTLTIASDGELTGSSFDIAGEASIAGSVDLETKKLSFVKSYGFSNLWTKWLYVGQMSEDGTTIEGNYYRSWSERETNVEGWGRFGLWVADPKVNHERMALEMLLRTHTETVPPSLGEGKREDAKEATTSEKEIAESDKTEDL